MTFDPFDFDDFQVFGRHLFYQFFLDALCDLPFLKVQIAVLQDFGGRGFAVFFYFADLSNRAARVVEVLDFGLVKLTQRHALRLALLFLLFDVDVLVLVGVFHHVFVADLVLEVSIQGTEVVVDILVLNLQCLLQVGPNLFEGRSILGRILQHLLHEVEQFDLVKTLEFGQINFYLTLIAAFPR